LKRLLIGLVAWLAPFCLPAQKVDNLIERIRNSPLPPEQREELERLFTGADFSRLEPVLEKQAGAPVNESASAVLYALAGAVEFLDGHMERAVVDFRLADRRAPLSDADRFTLSMALVKLNDVPAARAELTRLKGSHPESPLYLYWLARIDYDQRLYEEAVTKLRRVIQLDPASSRAYDNLGLALDMLGQEENARDAFQKAVDLNRKLPVPSAWPPHDLGSLLLRMQQFKDAETALRESLRYDSRFAMAHYHLGRVLEGEDRDSAAIDEYKAATSGDAPVMEAFYSLGLVYRRHDREADADAAFAEYKKRKAQSP
jgi:tetratricopeptide (TPR) repeat protein